MLLLTFPASCGLDLKDGDTPYRINLVDEDTDKRHAVRCDRAELERLIDDLKRVLKAIPGSTPYDTSASRGEPETPA